MQNIQDARMLGLGGAYSTLSSGYRAVGINPANINNGTSSTVNIFSSQNISGKTKAIVANTIKGKGLSFAENNNKFHHTVLTKALYEQGLKEI